MNSYQTVNAAFVTAGLKASAGVALGQWWHRVQDARPTPRSKAKSFHQFFDKYTLGDVSLSAPLLSQAIGHWNAEDKARQLRLRGLAENGSAVEWHGIRGKRADMIIVDDVEPTRSPWDASVLALQERGTRLRDQSEDRPQPKFLVAGYGLHGAYQVLRRRDLKLIATYTGEGAAEQANSVLDLLEKFGE